MNIDEQLQQLSRQTCPRQVDVVDAVMAQVRQRPYLVPVKRNYLWQRVALTAVAAALALVVVNVATARSYNETQIGDMLAYVSDYDYYAPVESVASNPIEYLYDEPLAESEQ